MRLNLRLLALAAILVAAPLGAEDRMRVHFIDVGQGLAALVELPCGAVLVDTGGEDSAEYDGRRALVEYLRAFFAGRPDLGDRLSLLVLTHPHPDHMGGVSTVLREFAPRNVVHNGQRSGYWSGQNRAMRYARKSGIGGLAVRQASIDPSTGATSTVIDPLHCGSVDPVLRVLWGNVTDSSGWWWEDFDEENNHSVVLRVDFGAASILFTGDLEEASWNSRARGLDGGVERLVAAYEGTGLLDVDVYQVGHHGSHNATTPELVAAMSPKIALIGAGPPCPRDGYTAWQHGHPREQTVIELEAGVALSRPAQSVRVFSGQRQPRSRTLDRAIYSTGWDGTIVLDATAAGWWDVVQTTGPHENCP